jgi:hypothetical protein
MRLETAVREGCDLRYPGIVDLTDLGDTRAAPRRLLERVVHEQQPPDLEHAEQRDHRDQADDGHLDRRGAALSRRSVMSQRPHRDCRAERATVEVKLPEFTNAGTIEKIAS